MSTLKADTIQNTSGGAATLTKQEAAKTLVHFDISSGTPTVVSSFNVASLADDGTGITQCNFTSNMSNDNYYYSGSISGNVATATIYTADPDTLTTSSVDIRSKYATASAVGLSDYNGQVGVIHGDLA